MLKALRLALVIVLGSLWLQTVPAYAQSAPVTTFQTPKTNLQQQVQRKAKSGWPWYLTRASGLLAAFLICLLILMGIGLVTGLTYRIMEPLTAWTVHRATGIALLGCVLVHVSVLLFDKYQPYTLLQLLIPFTATYKTTASALGVFAFYSTAIVVASSLAWMTHKPKTWKLLHFLSYVLVVLIFFHGILMGTDLAHGTLRWLWLIGGLIIIIGIFMRLWRAHTIDGDK